MASRDKYQREGQPKWLPFFCMAMAKQNKKTWLDKFKDIFTGGKWKYFKNFVMNAAGQRIKDIRKINNHLERECVNMLTVEKTLELMRAAGLDTRKFLILLAREDPSALQLSDEELNNVAGGAFIGSVPENKKGTAEIEAILAGRSEAQLNITFSDLIKRGLFPLLNLK